MQAIGKPIGTPNYQQNLLFINDGLPKTSTEVDEVSNHSTWPYAYFGVRCDYTVLLDGIRFLNNTIEWNHIEEVEIYILPPGKYFTEKNLVKVVDTTSTRMKLGWVEISFDQTYAAKSVIVRYTKITGGWAAPVAEIEFMNALYSSQKSSPDEKEEDVGGGGGCFIGSLY